MVKSREVQVGPEAFTLKPQDPLKLFKLETHCNPPALGPPQSRFRLSMSVNIPAPVEQRATGDSRPDPKEVKCCVGVLIHAPASSDFSEKGPEQKEGVAIWMETDGAGHKRYHVGGRDLLSTHIETKGYATWDSKKNDCIENVGASSDEPWFTEQWEISMEGQRGLAAVCDGRVKLRFRAGPTGGHVCFFNTGPAREGLQVHFNHVCMRELGTATVPRMTSSGKPTAMTRSMSDTNFSKSKTSGSGAQTAASGSLLDSMALHQSMRLAKYAHERPARVFMPALKCLMHEKRKVIEKGELLNQSPDGPRRKPKCAPWAISPFYQEFKPYQALTDQKEAAARKMMTKLAKPRRRKKKTEGEEEVLESDSDDDPDRPEKRLQKEQLVQLKELFDKFDYHKSEWCENTDIPKIFGTFLGYRHSPVNLVAAAVKLVVEYTAVQFADFLKVFVQFVDLEEAHMKKLVLEYNDNDAEKKLNATDVREVMRLDGEDFFPDVIEETIGGADAEIDADQFVLAFRQIRCNNGFTADEREEFKDVFIKFDQDESENVSSEELMRVLSYMGFAPSHEMLVTLVTTVDTDGSGEIDYGEFLTALRIYNEMQVEQFKEVFSSYDLDGSGDIDTSELYDAVKGLGWYPTRESIQEAVDRVDRDGSGEIDFDEFFQLMNHLRRTEGFTQAEINVFDTLFRKHDVDDSGEISTMELKQVLRTLGYPSSANLLLGLVAEVDVDGSGEIDQGELLKLLRKYRNHELKESERLFDLHRTSFDAMKEGQDLCTAAMKIVGSDLNGDKTRMGDFEPFGVRDPDTGNYTIKDRVYLATGVEMVSHGIKAGRWGKIQSLQSRYGSRYIVMEFQDPAPAVPEVFDIHLGQIAFDNPAVLRGELIHCVKELGWEPSKKMWDKVCTLRIPNNDKMTGIPMHTDPLDFAHFLSEYEATEERRDVSEDMWNKSPVASTFCRNQADVDHINAQFEQIIADKAPHPTLLEKGDIVIVTSPFEIYHDYSGDETDIKQKETGLVIDIDDSNGDATVVFVEHALPQKLKSNYFAHLAYLTVKDDKGNEWKKAVATELKECSVSGREIPANQGCLYCEATNSYNIGQALLSCNIADRNTWEQFLQFVAEYKKLELVDFQNRAGFDEKEVEQYLETFQDYDKEGDGELSFKELMPLLVHLGKEPRTVIQKQKLNDILADVDSDGQGELNFMKFLNLMRRFIDEADADQLRKEKEVIEKTGFNAAEVELWRDIFVKFDDDQSGEFDFDEGKKLLGAVGVRVCTHTNDDVPRCDHGCPPEAMKLVTKYKQIFHEVDGDKDEMLDFPEFLMMMKMMIDSDFGGLAAMSQKKPDEPGKDKKSKRKSRRNTQEDDK